MKVNKKERNLKPARVKRTATYKGITVRLPAGFSADTLQARREQNGILETLKDKNFLVKYEKRNYVFKYSKTHIIYWISENFRL